jgi:uncharacterized protein (DUF2147 family)
MLVIVAFLALAAAQDSPQPPIVGRWANPSHSVIIDIAACSDAFCGTVQWASAQAKEDASKGTDTLVGTQLLTAFQQKGSTWQGKLFVPDERLHVTGKLQSVSAQTLKVSGCAMGRTLCKSQFWTRADGPLPASD